MSRCRRSMPIRITTRLTAPSYLRAAYLKKTETLFEGNLAERSRPISTIELKRRRTRVRKRNLVIVG